MQRVTRKKMPRSKGSPQKCIETTNTHPSVNTLIFLTKGKEL